MRKGTTVVELLVVLAIVGVLFGLILSAVVQIRETAAVAISQNNQRQIGLSLHSFALDWDGQLPQAEWTFVNILPYLDSEPLYRKREDGSLNLMQGKCRTFINPNDASYEERNPRGWPFEDLSVSNLAVSSYAWNGQFFWNRPRMESMTDGASQTIWLTEHFGFNCNGTTFFYPIGITFPRIMSPAAFALKDAGDYYPLTSGNPPLSTAQSGVTFQMRPRLFECDPRLPNASSTRGLEVAFGDGSVRILRPGIAPTAFWAMVTPSGGEVSGVE